MKKFLQILFLSTTVLFSSLAVHANTGGGGNNPPTINPTHGSTCTVKTNNPAAGLVYANCAVTSYSYIGGYSHWKPDGPKDEDYVEEIKVECNSEGRNTTCEQIYYLYAKPNPGFKFLRWDDGPDNATTPEFDYKVSHSTTLPNHNPYYATAIFVAENAVNTETNIPAGIVMLDPEAPQIGQTVTATIKTTKLSENNSPENKNMMVEFDHWEDELGNNLGSEETISFPVEREMTLRAIYKDLSALPQKGKYYRVRNVYNRVLSVEGDFKVNIPMSGKDIPDALLRWALTYDHDYDEFHTSKSNHEWDEYEKDGKIWAEASPGTIFFMQDGEKNGNDFERGVLSSQGIDTKTLTDQTLKVTPMDPKFYGYYGVVAQALNEAGFQAMPRPAGHEDHPLDRCIVNVSGFKSSSIYCALAIQPIDEEHIENFWFGAYAEKEMLFEGGYWTSMYASFPYRIYDEKNVEAYYIKNDSQTINGITYLILTKIDDGVIPANSAVLLKCKDAENTKSNRLLPLNPSKVTKGELEGNILEGCIQLYSKEDKSEGYQKFDPSFMRVLGVNKNGDVGFYKLENDENGQEINLKTNKAYLNLDLLSSDSGSVSFRLATDKTSTGLESLVEDGSSVRFEDNAVYDIFGRKTSNPQAGNIYIVNGKKVLWR